jgi:predicted nucleic acid-binding protein/predicted GNAT family acetyltransferase
MQVEVISINEFDGGFDSVLEIYEKNKHNLGFLPRAVFAPFVDRNELLIAKDGLSVLGYLMFRYSKHNEKVRVVHLCVEKSHRGKGIATRLVQCLKEKFSHIFRITARCRNDFDSWNFWKSKSGFVAGKELPGRSKAGSILTEFFWEPNELPLFRNSINASGNEDSLPLVVLDANVFFDIYDSSRPFHEESNGLREDWLSEELELCVTSEIGIDISRSNDPAIISRSEKNLHGWRVLEADCTELASALITIEAIFGITASPRNESDRKHLAYAIANRATAFVTRDQEMLNKSEEVFQKTGLSLYRPSDLIIETDVLVNNDRYQFRELERTGIRIQRYAGQQDIPFSHFALIPVESERFLREKWLAAVSNPYRFDAYTVVDSNKEVVALSISSREGEKRSVSMIRIRRIDVQRRFGRERDRQPAVGFLRLGVA